MKSDYWMKNRKISNLNSVQYTKTNCNLNFHRKKTPTILLIKSENRLDKVQHYQRVQHLYNA